MKCYGQAWRGMSNTYGCWCNAHSHHDIVLSSPRWQSCSTGSLCHLPRSRLIGAKLGCSLGTRTMLLTAHSPCSWQDQGHSALFQFHSVASITILLSNPLMLLSIFNPFSWQSQPWNYFTLLNRKRPLSLEFVLAKWLVLFLFCLLVGFSRQHFSWLSLNLLCKPG